MVCRKSAKLYSTSKYYAMTRIGSEGAQYVRNNNRQYYEVTGNVDNIMSLIL